MNVVKLGISSLLHYYNVILLWRVNEVVGLNESKPVMNVVKPGRSEIMNYTINYFEELML